MSHDDIMKIGEKSKFDNVIVVGSEIRGVIAEYEKQCDIADKYRKVLESAREELKLDPTTRTCHNVINDIDEILNMEG